MSFTRLKTYFELKNGEQKIYTKDMPNDLALGLLKGSVFEATTDDEAELRFAQHSYENEVSQFVKRLMDGIESVCGESGETFEYRFFTDEYFAENKLLWGCFDLLIKADLTIGTIKHERMELLKENIALRSELDRIKAAEKEETENGSNT